MTPAELTALLVLATASSFTPGPNTTLSTALAANFGLMRAMRFVLAVPVGWGLLLAACAGGMAYLLWLAWKLAGSHRLGQADPARLQVSFAQGVGLQFLNIKAWMLALSIVAGWIAGQPDAGARFLVVLPILLAYALASNLTYALIGSMLRHWLARGARLRVFNGAMALALVLTAAWMLWSAL